MTYIDQAPNDDTKVSLIKTLEAVTEGKVRDGKVSLVQQGQVLSWAHMLAV